MYRLRQVREGVPFGAITVENNLAFIDSQKCKLCRKCVNECPTGAIKLVGMEPLPKEPKTPQRSPPRRVTLKPKPKNKQNDQRYENISDRRYPSVG